MNAPEDIYDVLRVLRNELAPTVSNRDEQVRAAVIRATAILRDADQAEIERLKEELRVVREELYRARHAAPPARPARKFRKLTDSILAEARQLRETGATWREIGEYTQCHPDTIRFHLKGGAPAKNGKVQK